jgi:hypothetical protein
MKPRAQGNDMESRVHGCAGVKDWDLIEVVIEEGVDAEDDLVEDVICEAPHRVCQARGHVRDEGTHRCYQQRACREGDQYKLMPCQRD